MMLLLQFSMYPIGYAQYVIAMCNVRCQMLYSVNYEDVLIELL